MCTGSDNAGALLFCSSTFQWKTFTILRYGRLSDSLVILIVTLVAIFVNLAVAIGAGIVFSALVYAWDSGTIAADMAVKAMIINGEECLAKYVHVKGAIFFSSTRDFIALFSVSEDPHTVVIDFKDALIIDHSAVAAIEGIVHRFAQAGKRVFLVNLPKKCHGRLQRTGDHNMIKNQNIDSSNFKDTVTPSIIDDEESQVDVPVEQPAEAAFGLSTQPHVVGASEEDTRPLNVNAGIANEGEALSNIPMFQLPTESIMSQLQHFLETQPEASIHEKKST